jgi:hypothetical protein
MSRCVGEVEDTLLLHVINGVWDWVDGMGRAYILTYLPMEVCKRMRERRKGTRSSKRVPASEGLPETYMRQYRILHILHSSEDDEG